MPPCNFPKEGDQYPPGLHRCTVCGRSVNIPLATPRIRATCAGQADPTVAARILDAQSADQAEVDRRTAICKSCANFDRQAPGCMRFKPCRRRTDWEGHLRELSCPDGHWGFHPQRHEPEKTFGRPGGDIFVMGAPGPVGGADTELWHLLRLLTSRRVTVHLIPTYGIDPVNRAKCEGTGCVIHETTEEGLPDVVGLPGSTVVSLCNSAFLDRAPVLRSLGCRLVWVNCMCWLFEAEKQFVVQHGGFDTWVCQSEHQRKALAKGLHKLGVGEERLVHIPGAFMVDEFPYQPRPHAEWETFVFGRMARADADKWSSNLWTIYNAVPYPKKHYRVMGWREQVEAKMNAKPQAQRVDLLQPNAEPAGDFLRSLHALVPINGGAEENWPRVGLEAMAAGVPIVTQNAWGWREMVEHGKTGLLCDNDGDFAYHIARLARDEPYRLALAHAGRKRLEELCNPETLWEKWQKVLFP